MNFLNNLKPKHNAGFTKINPNQKIPALIDATSGKDVRVFESGSILLHLATKYDRFIPHDPERRVECMNWLFWNIGTAPFIGGGFVSIIELF